MGLIGGMNALFYARNYRHMWFSGRQGGGKTALAFRMAHDLCRQFKFRYIVSTSKSPWAVSPDTVTLREGVWADTVLILDEAGLYIRSPAEAKSWMAFLRKLNCVLLMPSVVPPSSLFRTVSVTRSYNLEAFGLPFWRFDVNISEAGQRVKDSFWWYKPSEIFGCYDTLGQPQDADELLIYLKKWAAASQAALGYQTSRTESNVGAMRLMDYIPVSSPDNEEESEVVEALHAAKLEMGELRDAITAKSRKF